MTTDAVTARRTLQDLDHLVRPISGRCHGAGGTMPCYALSNRGLQVQLVVRAFYEPGHVIVADALVREKR